MDFCSEGNYGHDSAANGLQPCFASPNFCCRYSLTYSGSYALLSASKVETRHSLLLSELRTFKEEDDANALLAKLTWVLPTIVITFSLFDLILALIYLTWLHPWKIILDEVKLVPDLQNCQNNRQLWIGFGLLC